jgi:signal transduction histidine kinase
MTEIHHKRFNYIFDSLDQTLLVNSASIIAPLLQRIQSTKQLQKLNQELEDAESIREHEMRGPLQLIGSQASFVSKHLLNQSSTSKPRRLQTILTNVSICTTLLTSTKLPNPEDFALELQAVNLREMVLSIADVLNLQIESQSPGAILFDPETQDLQFHTTQFMLVEVTGACPACFAHPIYLQRAFYNLGTNALKYARRTTEVGRLTIDLSTDITGRNARILFKDTGVGINPDEVAQIFLGRFRGSASKGRRGKGLGPMPYRNSGIDEAHGVLDSSVAASVFA